MSRLNDPDISTLSVSLSCDPTATPASPPPSETAQSDVELYLNLQDMERSKHDAPNLVWNQTLTNAAQYWANGCIFEHSGGTLGHFGENLAAGTGAYSISSAIQEWIQESDTYDPDDPQASHWTQVVWKATTDVGCAESTCGAGVIFPGFGPAQYYVCEYWPQGNVGGEYG
ncbi:CAP domain-containing protein [Mycena olivaceomarginata]|nr:CAP domain-containing protein [Mycena olivaceomarginata]